MHHPNAQDLKRKNNGFQSKHVILVGNVNFSSSLKLEKEKGKNTFVIDMACSYWKP